MPNPKKSAEDTRRKPAEDEVTSSPGDNSPSVTPKDVCSEDAASKDVTARKTDSPDPDEREEEMLDDAVDMSFPASDPIAIPTPSRDRDKSRGGQHRP